MMRILLPSIVDPSVQKGGAWTATRGLLAMLRSDAIGAEVDVLPARDDSRFGHSLRKWTSMGTALFSGEPAKILFHRRRAMLDEFHRLSSGTEYDFVLLNGSDLLWLLPHISPGTRVAVVAHNVEHQLQAAYLQSRLKLFRPLLARDCERLRRCEIAGLRKAGFALFLSSEDQAYIRSECPDISSIHVPPVFSEPPGRKRVRRVESSELHVGMMANFDWWPNREGINWFLRDVFPSVPSAIVLHLFGLGSREVAGSRERVVGHGYVESPGEVWPTCDFMICPILSGSGVCIKVAEAIYNNVPVLATPFSVRGLSLPASEAIALREGASAWTRFLSAEASGFALQTLPENFSARFHMSVHAGLLSDFLSAIPCPAVSRSPLR